MKLLYINKEVREWTNLRLSIKTLLNYGYQYYSQRGVRTDAESDRPPGGRAAQHSRRQGVAQRAERRHGRVLRLAEPRVGRGERHGARRQDDSDPALGQEHDPHDRKGDPRLEHRSYALQQRRADTFVDSAPYRGAP